MIKTTVKKASDAYIYINDFLNQPLPAKVGFKFFSLRNKLKEHFDYACIQEKKAIERFGANVGDDRKLKFENNENAVEYIKFMNETFNCEVEIDAEPIDISSLGDNISIRINAMVDFLCI